MKLPINQIVCGDCLEVMKDWPDDCVDLVLTDPPYGLNIVKGGSLSGGNVPYQASDWDASPPKPEYFKQMVRLSVNQVIWGGNYFPCLWLKPCRGFIYWNKLNHHTNRADGELAWTSFDMCARHFDYMWDGNRYGFPNQPIRGVGQPTTRTHPTEKPLELMLWLLREFSRANQLILDPFCGSGTTCVAAKMLGRNYIGIDISEEYCKIARQRIKAVDTGVPVKEQRQGQMALFGKEKE